MGPVLGVQDAAQTFISREPSVGDDAFAVLFSIVLDARGIGVEKLAGNTIPPLYSQVACAYTKLHLESNDYPQRCDYVNGSNRVVIHGRPFTTYNVEMRVRPRKARTTV
jgi:hypothetical protein